MPNIQYIQYFVSREKSGDLCSRVGNNVIHSSVCYDPSGDFSLYDIGVSDHQMTIFEASHWLTNGRWTKKVPIEWKNAHREAWGLPALKEEKPLPEWYLDWDSIYYIPTPENVGSLPEGIDDWMAGLVQSQKRHWYGDRSNFKTWVFVAPLATVKDELVPLLKGSSFTAKLKGW